MHQYDFIDARHALYHLVDDIWENGDKVSPRGQATREIRHVTISIQRSETCLPTEMGRNVNTRLAAAETLQLIGGFADPDWMTAVSPRYLEFTGGAMTGAYGPRLRDQLEHVLAALRKDNDTRQAVAVIWDPSRDLMMEHGDRPCTVYVSFMIRRGMLITSTYMRSQDLYLGFTYDMVMFSQLHQTMANLLRIPAGDHVHTVQSLHLYERNFDAVSAITEPPPWPATALYGLGENCVDWIDVQNLARRISYSDKVFVGASITEDWFRAQSEAARA